jgi:putative hydrolase of the HAD superfamily
VFRIGKTLSSNQADQTLREIRFRDWISDFLKRENIVTEDGLAKLFLEKYYQPIFAQVTLIDGAKETLEDFRSQGLRIGLISNSAFPSEYHCRELEHFGISQYFDFMVFSHDFGYRKPYPGLFKHALGELKLDASDAAFVGDRLKEDVGGAQGVGMKAILRFKSGRDYSCESVPDAVVHHLTELPKVLKRLF